MPRGHSRVQARTAYEERQRMQKAFGYTYDEMKQSILPMAKNGSEAIASMGVDTPLPVLSMNVLVDYKYHYSKFS